MAVTLTSPAVLPRVVNTTLGLANIVTVVTFPVGEGWSISFQPRATAAKLADASNTALTDGGALGAVDVLTLQADRLTAIDLSSNTSGTLYLASATASQVVEITLDRG